MKSKLSFNELLALLAIGAIFIITAPLLFFSVISAEVKGTIIGFYITAGTLIFQFFYRKKGADTNGEEPPKADSPATGDPTGSSSAVQGLGETCKTCNTTSTDKSDFTISDAPIPATEPKVDKIIDSIFKELKADSIKQTAAAVASRIVSWLGAHESELTNSEKADLLDYGIGIAQQAYVDVTGIAPAPQSYKEVADYNKWWREHQKACKAPKGEARAVLMTLRDLLKRGGL